MKANSKRGVALAYVVMVTAVLTILAAALMTGAAFNREVGENSAQSRQAYLTAKGAVEYARVYLEKNIATLNTPGTSFYIVCKGNTPEAGFDVLPTGTPAAGKVYAKVSVDAGSVSISASAPYLTKEKARGLGYQSGVTVIAPEYVPNTLHYIVCGNSYFHIGYAPVTLLRDYPGVDAQDFLEGNFGSGGWDAMPGPLLVSKPICRSAVGSWQTTVDTSRLFFMGDGDARNVDYTAANQCYYAEKNARPLTLKADFIYFANNLSGYLDNGVLKLTSHAGAGKGVLYADKAIVVTERATGNSYTIEKGFYYFQENLNLFDLSALPAGLTRLSESEEDNYQSEIKEVRFIQRNVTQMVPSESCGWSNVGVAQASPPPQANKIVYFALKDNAPKGNYSAKQVLFHHLGYNPMQVNQSCSFDCDYLFLSINAFGQPASQSIKLNNNSSLVLHNCRRVRFDTDVSVYTGWQNTLVGVIPKGVYNRKANAPEEVDLKNDPNGENGFLSVYELSADGDADDELGHEGSITMDSGVYTNG